MTTYRAIHGNNPLPEDHPVMRRCPKHGDLPEGYAVIRKRGVRLLMDATGEELTRPADLWTEAPVLPQCRCQAKPDAAGVAIETSNEDATAKSIASSGNQPSASKTRSKNQLRCRQRNLLRSDCALEIPFFASNPAVIFQLIINHHWRNVKPLGHVLLFFHRVVIAKHLFHFLKRTQKFRCK